MKRTTGWVLGAVFALSAAHANEKTGTAERGLGEGHAGIEAIALYPEPIRTAILEASAHPELIIKVASLQQSSSEKFEGIMSSLEREDQEAVWDLTRFPALVEALVEGDIKTKKRIRQILADYPEEIHETALKYGRTEYDLLADMQHLDEAAGKQFEGLIGSYPPATQNSYRTLVGHPEIMSILAEDISMTVLLGDAYKNDPEGVQARAAELNLKLAREHAEDLALLNDSKLSPATGEDLKDVAEVYQKKYAYDDSGFEGPGPQEVEVTYHGAPYPYWFGYPRWYAVPRFHAGLSWYIAPTVRASVPLFPTKRLLYRHAPFHYHARVWSKGPRGGRIKVVERPSRRHRRR